MTERRSRYIVALLAACAVCGVYLRALGNGFVAWDDNRYVYENLHLRSLDWSFLKWTFLGFHAGNWHPLTWISHAADYAVWGLDPMGHHLSGVVIHAVNTFLVVLLAARLIEARSTCAAGEGRPFFPDGRSALFASGVAGLLFGLHPLHVESVAWVSERKDLLCALFYLLSLMAYVSFGLGGDNKSGRSYKAYFLSLFLFVLALMSKPMAVSLPVVLLVLDWYPLGRVRTARMFARACFEKLPFFALSIGSAVVTFMAQRAGAAVAPLAAYPLSARLLVGFRSVVLYLWKMALPLKLLPYYAYPKEVSVSSPGFFLPLALVAAITAVCLFTAGRQRLASATWVCYAAMLVPVLGVVQVGSQSMADRYTYLPSLGPFLLAGLGAGWLVGRKSASRNAKVRGGLAGLLVLSVFVALSYATFHQIGVWKDSFSLWGSVIAADPEGGPVPYDHRGELLCGAGRPDLAIADFDHAIALDASDATSYNNRGIALEMTGRQEDALADYGRAIALEPRYYLAYYNRAVLLSRMGKRGPALKDYDRAIALDGSVAKAYNNRGIVLDMSGFPEKAMKDFDRAIQLDPGHASSYFNRGKLFMKTGDRSRAFSDFQEACELGNRASCEELRSTEKK
ncbi:MAG: tetratricopeptide repeat protein [Nitrospiraceae bacterium]|nr:tetratricopeptide repeat protein [Nitrospiraceae bacterium]